MRILGIDIGSTDIKGAILDTESIQLNCIQRVPFPPPIQTNARGRHETDPEEIFLRVMQLVERLSGTDDGLEGLLLSSQMHGLVLVDSAGRPQTSFISWRDERCATEEDGTESGLFSEIQKLVSEEAHSRTGRGLRPGLPICALYWYRKRSQLLRNMIPLPLPSYIQSRLCGTLIGTDTTQAASQGALNIETLEWDRDLLAALELEGLHWPDVHQPGDAVSTFRFNGKSLNCYAAVGDHQASLVGTLLKPQEIAINVSTGSQVSRLTTEFTVGDFQIRPYFDNFLLKTITNLPAGRALDALVSLLCEIPARGPLDRSAAWDYILHAVSAVDRTDLEVDLSFFPSFYGDRGCIGNIRESQLNVGSLFAACFEGMAENYARCAQTIMGCAPVDSIQFSGSVALRSHFLRSRVADRLKLPARVSQVTEDALFGLLVMGVGIANRVRVMEAMSIVESTLKQRAGSAPAGEIPGEVWR